MEHPPAPLPEPEEPGKAVSEDRDHRLYRVLRGSRPNYAARLVLRCRTVFFMAMTLPRPVRPPRALVVRREPVRDPRDERVERVRVLDFALPRAVVLLRLRPRVVAVPRRVEVRDFEPRTRDVVARREPA